VSGFDLIRAAYDAAALDEHERAVLVLLAFMANEEGKAWPGIAHIVERTGKGVVLATIITSYVMSDGKQFFHADHGNLAGTGAAPSVASLDEGRLAMRSQKTTTGRVIDANPKFVLVPATLQTAAEVLVASTIAPATTADVNPFAGKLEPISDPRLPSPTAWYLFADPNVSAALEYAYLNGQSAPMTDSQEGWRVDGTEYKVRHDFGAGVTDYRMAWKNPGAA